MPRCVRRRMSTRLHVMRLALMGNSTDPYHMSARSALLRSSEAFSADGRLAGDARVEQTVQRDLNLAIQSALS
jgi:hypothetical protein